MNKEVKKNMYGFYELVEKPTPEYLNEWYEKEYYRNNCSKAYAQTYNEQEIKWIKNNIKLVHQVIKKIKNLNETKPKLLDIGCGEGWVLQYFHEEGWDVSGLDINSFGIENHNPAMLNYFQQGDIYKSLTQLGEQKYDIIWLSEVLQIVLDPVLLIKLIKNPLKKNSSQIGVMIIIFVIKSRFKMEPCLK